MPYNVNGIHERGTFAALPDANLRAEGSLYYITDQHKIVKSTGPDNTWIDWTDAFILSALLGAPDGVATLDGDATLTASQIPASLVEDTDLAAEAVLRTSGDSALDARLDTLEGQSLDTRLTAVEGDTTDVGDAVDALDGRVTTLEADAPYVPASSVGVAGGVADLDGSGKVPTARLPASVLGDVAYQGTWDATTNSPTIPAAASGNKGQYYVVATAGSTNIDGVTDWKLGDWLVSNGATWDKIDNTDSVNSVAGKTGAVTLVAADVSDATTVGNNVLTAASQSAARTALGAGTASVLDSDTDGTLAANSDAKTATQKAVKTYIAAQISGVSGGVGSTRTVKATWSGGTSVPTTGVKGSYRMPNNFAITKATIWTDGGVNGSAVVNIRKSSYAGFPGSLASIVAAAKPTLSAAQKAEDATLTGWTLAGSAGDYLQFELESASTLHDVSVELEYTVTP